MFDNKTEIKARRTLKQQTQSKCTLLLVGPFQHQRTGDVIIIRKIMDSNISLIENKNQLSWQKISKFYFDQYISQKVPGLEVKFILCVLETKPDLVSDPV